MLLGALGLRYVTTRCDAVRCGAVQCGAVQCGAVCCGTVAVRCDAVRCGAMQCSGRAVAVQYAAVRIRYRTQHTVALPCAARAVRVHCACGVIAVRCAACIVRVRALRMQWRCGMQSACSAVGYASGVVRCACSAV